MTGLECRAEASLWLLVEHLVRTHGLAGVAVGVVQDGQVAAARGTRMSARSCSKHRAIVALPAGDHRAQRATVPAARRCGSSCSTRHGSGRCRDLQFAMPLDIVLVGVGAVRRRSAGRDCPQPRGRVDHRGAGGRTRAGGQRSDPGQQSRRGRRCRWAQCSRHGPGRSPCSLTGVLGWRLPSGDCASEEQGRDSRVVAITYRAAAEGAAACVTWSGKIGDTP